MSKEKILEEFDKLTPYPEDCGSNYDEQKEWLVKNNHLYNNEVYNEPMYDLSESKIKDFLSKAIDQTREETIREVEDVLNYLDNNREEHQIIEEIRQSLKSLINK